MTADSDNSDIRWKQRFANWQSSYRHLQSALAAVKATPANDLLQIALIKLFEMTFELSWNTMKDYLSYNGISANLPRDIIKQAFANEIIADGQLWIDMLQDRNLMAHIYDQSKSDEAVAHICDRYIVGFEQLANFLTARLK